MKQIIESLKIYKPLSQVELPKETGFYAFFVISRGCFDGTVLSQIKKDDCVYIGIAEDETLFERVTESHLIATGRSTFRRSLGAVLRTKLDLKPIQRGIVPTKSNLSNYAFSTESEKRLTDFMYKHIGIAFHPFSNLDCSLNVIEKKLIEQFDFPVFNIEYSGIKNPHKRIIQELRKDCRRIVSEQL